MEETGLMSADSAPDLVVTVFSEELRRPSLEIASRLRREGLRVDLYRVLGS
jgi:hypothetical protein